jgi:hypothetical protein
MANPIEVPERALQAAEDRERCEPRRELRLLRRDLGSLKRAIGDLDRIAAWLRIEGFILAAPGFDRTTNVLNGCSELLLDLFGPEVGEHARFAMGVAATPLSCPVVVAGEVALRPSSVRR